MDVGTAFLGAGLGVIGWVGLKFFADPILEQWRVRGKIADALIFYANAYLPFATAGIVLDEIRDASSAIRKLAAEIEASRHSIRCYRLLERLRLVVPRGAVISVRAELIGWSNDLYDDGSVQAGGRFERRMRIAELLGLDHDLDVAGGTRDTRILSSTRTETPIHNPV